MRWLATAVLLEISGAGVGSAANHDVYQLVIGVAANDLSVELVASSLKELPQQ